MNICKTTAAEAEFEEFEPRLKYAWFFLNFVFNVSRFKPALS